MSSIAAITSAPIYPRTIRKHLSPTSSISEPRRGRGGKLRLYRRRRRSRRRCGGGAVGRGGKTGAGAGRRRRPGEANGHGAFGQTTFVRLPDPGISPLCIRKSRAAVGFLGAPLRVHGAAGKGLALSPELGWRSGRRRALSARQRARRL